MLLGEPGDEVLDLGLHTAAETVAVSFGREVLGIEGDAHLTGEGGRKLTGVEHRDQDLAGEREQWVTLAR